MASPQSPKMSSKTRTRTRKQGRTTTNTNTQNQYDNPSNPLILQQVSPRSFTQRMLTSTSHLTNLLPTWTLLAFQLLIPIFSNNGFCDPIASLVTKILLVSLATSCFFACFTDSFRAPDGQIYYGMATFRGLWLFEYPETASILPDFPRYKLGFTDLVHAVLSVLVFAAIALRDKNVYSCFYPHLGHEKLQMMDAVSIVIGLLCSTLFLVFPTRRHDYSHQKIMDVFDGVPDELCLCQSGLKLKLIARTEDNQVRPFLICPDNRLKPQQNQPKCSYFEWLDEYKFRKNRLIGGPNQSSTNLARRTRSDAQRPTRNNEVSDATSTSSTNMTAVIRQMEIRLIDRDNEVKYLRKIVVGLLIAAVIVALLIVVVLYICMRK